MKTASFRLMKIAALAAMAMLLKPDTSHANDLENFLRALQGNSRPTANPALRNISRNSDPRIGRQTLVPGHVRDVGGSGLYGHGSNRQLTSRDLVTLQHARHGFIDQRNSALRGGGFDHRLGASVWNPPGHVDRLAHNRHYDINRTTRSIRSPSSGVQLSFTIGSPRTAFISDGGFHPGVVPSVPGGGFAVPYGQLPSGFSSPPVLAYPPHPGALGLPHQLGEIVDCPVPLATCVKIEDPHNIAPGAVPVIVAVRDPNLPAWHAGCVDAVVYVEVCAPPCPLQKLTISSCNTRMRLDFGQYEIDITSCKGHIVVDYDD